MNHDVIFLTYKEPAADARWNQLQKIIPMAKRVHGVKGFDAALKECANISATDRFYVIDGDNLLLPSFQTKNIRFEKISPSYATLSWPAVNNVNGLIYGNGGIKNWHKACVQELKSHETAESLGAKLDYCQIVPYISMAEPLSKVEINDTAESAFRSGYREGIKLVMENGKLPEFISSEPKPFTLKNHVWFENISRIKIWCSVGADIKHGLWSILGARMGLSNALKGEYNFIENIHSYDWFEQFWNSIYSQYKNQNQLQDGLLKYQTELNEEYSLGITLLSLEASVFFKSVYINPKRV